MFWCVQCYFVIVGQFFVVGQLVVWGWYWCVGYVEQLVLYFQVVLEELVVFVQVQVGVGVFFYFVGGQEVIQMCVGMDDVDYLQVEVVEVLQDQFVVVVWIDDDGFFGQWIVNDGVVVL